MEYFYQLIHSLIHKSKPGGLEFEPIGDGASPKFKRYREEHGEELFGYVPPKTLGKAKALMAKKGYPNQYLPFQNSILSCVHATIAFTKGVYSDFELFYTWRWTYGQVPHFNGGTRFKDGMGIAQKGMLLDNYLPQAHFWGAEAKMQEIWIYDNGWHKATAKEKEALWNIAEKKKLGHWEYIYGKDMTAIKHAVQQKGSVPIGVYVQRGNWHNNGVIKWLSGRAGDFGHAIAIYDWNDDEQCWIIADWDNRGFKKLSYSYPLAFVASVSNGKDNDINKAMNRVVKLADDPKYWVIFADNTRAHIPSWDLFRYGFQKGYWVNGDKVEVIKPEELARIAEDKNSNHLLKIMEEFNQSHI